MIPFIQCMQYPIIDADGIINGDGCLQGTVILEELTLITIYI